MVRLGFRFSHQTGSHATYKHSDGRRITIAFHPRDIPTGLLRRIIKDLGMTVEAFNDSI